MLFRSGSASAAAIGALALLGIIAAVVLTSFTFSPTLKEAINSNLKEVPGGTEEAWLAIVTKGPRKGMTADATWAISTPKSYHKANGALAFQYYVQTCSMYSSTGEEPSAMGADGTALMICEHRPVTEAEVREYVKTLLAETPSA